MKILVLNCGSSSIKYKLFDMDSKEVIAQGGIEKIGLKGSFLKLTLPNGEKKVLEKDIPEHTVGVEFILNTLVSPEYGAIKSLDEIDAVGHRMVHGGERFSKSVLLDKEVLEAFTACNDLAPLHNPANLKGVDAISAILPNIPQVGVFDTAFHQTMPDYAYLYAVPYELYEKYGVRRYGFHGTSHRYVSQRVCEYLGVKPEGLKLITCHIGNGGSIAAIKDGKCIDTTMGLTPLEGLMMGTRSGDIDAGAVTFIMDKEGLNTTGISNLLNKKSGVLGVSGVSSDMRELEAAVAEGNPKAILAEKMYFYRFTNRFDMGRYYTETVYEDNRFVVYKNPHSFPLAYGTNSLVKNIQFGVNNAFANQNIILNSMEGHQKNTGDYVEYFKPLAFTGIETENLIEEKVNKDTGEAIYRRADSSKEGIIRYKVIPQSNNTYYFFVPASLIPKQDYSVLVNNKWLPNSKTFTQRQIWQLTDMAENQESVIEFRFRTDTIDMSQAGVYRAELDQIQEVLEKRKQQGLKVTKFGNTHIEGNVTITDDSDVMMTSIPYSAGWQVKVDGQSVPTERAWNSFLSFPITKGKHQVEFVFKTRGSLIGALLSIVAVVSLVIIRKRWKEEHA